MISSTIFLKTTPETIKSALANAMNFYPSLLTDLPSLYKVRDPFDIPFFIGIKGGV